MLWFHLEVFGCTHRLVYIVDSPFYWCCSRSQLAICTLAAHVCSVSPRQRGFSKTHDDDGAIKDRAIEWPFVSSDHKLS